jgi:flagellar biosynthesis protein FlhB
MKTFLFFTFLVSLAKSGLWISIGILIKNHLETLLSLIVRKPLPDHLIEENKLETFNQVTKWIGLFIIIIGIGFALSALATLIMGFNMPTSNFNFKF